MPIQALKKHLKRFVAAADNRPRRKKAIKRLSESKLLPKELRFKLRGFARAQWREEPLKSTGGPFPFYYPSQSEVGIKAAEFGEWDDFSFIFKNFIKNPRTIIEVGSNIGIDTVPIAQLAGESCRVFAFEPVKKYRDYLQMNVAENKLSNVETRSDFLSNRSGDEIELHINSTSASAVANGTKSFPTLATEKAVTITLDDFAKNMKLDSLDFLKTDTDGYDQAVIEGGREIIAKYQPLLFVEFSGYLLEKARGDSDRSLAELLRGLGYNRFFLFAKEGAPPHELRGVEALLSKLNHESSANVFAIPEKK